MVLSVAAIFAAGLSLGNRTDGRDADERAALEAFVEAYRIITGDFVGGSEPEVLVEAAIRGMFETLDDPYSAFMGNDEFDATLSGISGEFEGIGARMTSTGADGAACGLLNDECRLLVTEVLAGSPAEKAGLLENDEVVAADGRELAALTIDDAVLLIRGPRGTEVTLTIERANEELPLTIIRDVIRSEDVRSATLADGDIGYIRIDSFSSNADEDFREQLGVHLAAGVSGLIVDVRADPGGFVDSAVAIASEFVGSGPILWEENAAGERRSFDARAGGLATETELGLVLLIDDGSASASEILAGALRDDDRATLVGEATFGKGSVQEWTQLPGENGGFRLSVARWLTRDQEWIDGDGIEPDIEVTGGRQRYWPGGSLAPEDDPQLVRALQVLGAAIEGQAATPDPSASSSSSSSPAPSSPR